MAGWGNTGTIMIFFCFMSGGTDAVRAAYDRAVAGFQSAIPVQMTRPIHKHLAANGGWAVVAYGEKDPLASKRLVMGPSGCVVINGPLLGFDGKQGDEAIKAVAQALAIEDIDRVYERMEGSFAVGGFLARHGLFGFGDFSAMTPNYWGVADDLTVIGNKPSVVEAALPGERATDIRSLSWLIGHANIFGTAMPTQGVHQIEPETCISARRGHRARIKSLPTIWPDAGQDLVDDLTEGEWDELTHHLVENTRRSLTYFDKAQVALTGGKDSRLNLALVRAVRDRDAIEVFTRGRSDNPDVETAAFIAREMGIRHNISAPAPPSAVESYRVWERLPAHVSRFDAIICPWDGLTDDLRSTTLTFTGFGGSLYRGSHANRALKTDIANLAEMQAAWRNYHQPFDPLGVLRPAYAEFQQSWTDQWLSTNSSHPSVLPEKFMVENRVGRSSGPLMQNVPGRIKIAPMMSRPAARLFFKLQKKARAAELLNYEVMKRTAPELTRIPFMKQVWSPMVLAKDPELPDRPFATTSEATAQSVAPRQFEFISGEAGRIESLLLQSKKDTEIDSMLDINRTIESMNDEKLMRTTVNAKTIFSALAIASRLLGDERMPRDVLNPT